MYPKNINANSTTLTHSLLVCKCTFGEVITLSYCLHSFFSFLFVDLIEWSKSYSGWTISSHKSANKLATYLPMVLFFQTSKLSTFSSCYLVEITISVQPLPSFLFIQSIWKAFRGVLLFLQC